MYEYNRSLQKIINYDNGIEEKFKKHNPNWPSIPDYPCIILLIGSSESRKTNTLLNKIKRQSHDD